MGVPDNLESEALVNRQYLQAEFARIDILLRREIRCWQTAGQDPQDAFRGLAISDQDAERIAELPFGATWGSGITLPEDEEKEYLSAWERAEARITGIIEEARSQSIEPRLVWLAREFDLDRFELDALLICLAPAFDPRYERLYGYLQDDITRKQPGVQLILNLLAEPGPGRLDRLAHFSDEAILLRHRLVEVLPEGGPARFRLIQFLQASPTVAAWLLGVYQPPSGMEGLFRLSVPGEDETDHILAAPVDAVLESPYIDKGGLEAPILGFYGLDQAGQDAAARRCAVIGKKKLLSVNLELARARQISLVECIRLALRDARLTQSIPYLTGLDAWQADEREGAERPASAARLNSCPLPRELLAELCETPGLVLVSGRLPWQAAGVDRAKPMFWVEFPVPPYPRRLELWKYFLERAGRPRPVETAVLPALAGQFALHSGQIRDAVASAGDFAAQSGYPVGAEALFTAARLHSNSILGGMARKVEPRYRWDDLILPKDQLELLREIVSTVRCRPQVLEEWGVGQKLVASAGIPILFSGPPGTGKTMAAEVIAHELGLDLYKIELSGIVSKYIGETEKNLEKIFNEAEHSNAILFFDEADAIFGKRSEVKDAHDRYANIEISYLLQRMELYGGVTILATNLRGNLDEAFTRRLQFAIDFPFPDEEHRKKIWGALFPASIPHEPDLDFSGLARTYKLAGGNIRNIIVGAAYLAAEDGKVVNMDHLLHSVRRELQKMGRLVNEKEKKM